MTATVKTPEIAESLVVTRRELLTDEVVLLELKRPDGSDLPAWTPGSHIDLVLEDELIRQYSLCGDPADRTAWTVAVFLEPAGRGGSARIHETVHLDKPLSVKGPRNHFEFSPTDRVIFIGGGIGITPLIPMMIEAESQGVDWVLHYGGRSRNTMAFSDSLVSRFGADRVKLVPQDELGFIDLATILETPSISGTSVYTCGPAPLLEAVEKHCVTWPAGALHLERFTALAIDESTNTEFEVELATSGVTFTVPADRSILDLIDEHDIPLASSCRDGTCGTCETLVVSGTPEHRDAVLSKEEQESNEVMMVCVSRSLCPKLVLDL